MTASLPGRSVPEPLEGLIELALNLAWARTSASEELWSRVDPDTWQTIRNPWLILQTVSERRLEELAADTDFCQPAAERTSRRSARRCAGRAGSTRCAGPRRPAPWRTSAWSSA